MKIVKDYFLWILFLITFPFYFLGEVGEGGLQISSGILILVIVLNLKSVSLTIFKDITLRKFYVFVFYVLVINFVWTFILMEISILYNVLYYVFNLLLLAYGISNVKDLRFWRATYYGILSSLILVLILFPFWKSNYRTIAFFNNPNQLGYWALLCGAFIHVYSVKFNLTFNKKTILLLFPFVFVMLSLSRASIISYSILFLISIFLLDFKKSVVSVLFLVLGVAIFQPNLISKIDYAEQVQERMDNKKGTNPNERGYDRIVNHPEYLFFGAGEGQTWRFNSKYSGEIHSSFGTLLFSYGIIGLILFLNIFRNLRWSDIKYSITLLPIMAYSITHNGLRFSMLWVVLIFILGYSLTYKRILIKEII